MRPRRLVAAIAAIAAVALAFAIAQPLRAQRSSTPDPAHAIEGASLREALARGGYVLYFRHAATDFGQNDEAMTDFADCGRQRNLTAQGRDDARRIGEAIARLRLPVARVLASPFCRTQETARLMFGRADVSLAVRGGPANVDDDRYAGLRALLATVPAPGADDVIVSHGNPFVAVAGPPYLAEGEAAIVEPLGDGRFRVVARVRKDQWDALAR